MPETRFNQCCKQFTKILYLLSQFNASNWQEKGNSRWATELRFMWIGIDASLGLYNAPIIKIYLHTLFFNCIGCDNVNVPS